MSLLFIVVLFVVVSSSCCIVYCVAYNCFCYFQCRIVNPRRACAARVTVLGLCVCVCVCVSVCVSVTQHLTFYVFIHATNDTNLLGGG